MSHQLSHTLVIAGLFMRNLVIFVIFWKSAPQGHTGIQLKEQKTESNLRAILMIFPVVMVVAVEIAHVEFWHPFRRLNFVFLTYRCSGSSHLVTQPEKHSSVISCPVEGIGLKSPFAM